MQEKKAETYLVLTPFFPSDKSHHGVYIFDQVNALKQQTKFDIVVVKLVSCFSREEEYFYKGFRVLIFKSIDFPFFIFPSFFHLLNQKRWLNFLCKKEVKNIDFVHAHVNYPSAFYASLIAKYYPAISIVQHHGLDVLQLLNGRIKFLSLLWRNVFVHRSIVQLNKMNIQLGVSEKVLEQFRQFPTYQPQREWVLYNGVDDKKFYPTTKPINNNFTIGCVANFWAIKDHISLIKAVELLLKDGITCNLYLVGNGPTWKRCYQYVEEKHLQSFIFFKENIAHEDLNEFYNKIDLFVMPSYFEAFGCVYLESWATHTPFIAIKGQGIEEVIPENSRRYFLADKQSPTDLKEKIKYWMNNKLDMPINQDLLLENTIKNFVQKLNNAKKDIRPN